MKNTATRTLSQWTGIGLPAIDFWLQKVHPVVSLRECRAQVRDIDETCAGVKTVTLRPNRRWKGFVAGQHVHVTLDVDGVRLRRTWTISSSADARDITLTIGRIPNGRATSWVHEHLQVGDIVQLSEAQGTFTLPSTGAPVVFLAGGAGITPALSMLRTMRDRNDMRAFELVHFVRDSAHAICRLELEGIQDALPNVRVHIIETHDGDPIKEQRVSAELLTSLNLGRGPDLSEWMLCGPSGFMDACQTIIEQIRPEITARFERFTPPSMEHAGQGGTIHLAREGAALHNAATDNLLTAIEATGRNPKHGCRAGICFQCTCTKTSGVVLDLRTGKLLDEDGEKIQLCVSQAVGEVTLDL